MSLRYAVHLISMDATVAGAGARVLADDRRAAFAAAAALLVIACLGYWPLFGYPLSTGDTLPLLMGTWVQDWQDLQALLTTRLLDGTSFHGYFYRPAALLSLAFDQWLWGIEPLGFYVTNVVIHAACSYLVYHCGQGLFYNRTVAMVAAVLFVIHPLGVELVPSIARRQDLLACLFTLLSIALILRWRERQHACMLLLSGVAYLAAMSSKELAVYTPAVIGAILLLPDHGAVGRRVPPRSFLHFTLWFGVLLGLYLVARNLVVGMISGYGDPFNVTRSVNMALSAADHLFLPDVWQALLGSPPSWLDGRGFLGASAALVATFLLVWVRQGRENAEIPVRLVIVLWAFLPLAVCIATSTFAYRSLYSALPPICLLLASAVSQATTAMPSRGAYWTGKVIAVSAGAFIGLQVAFSPVLHRYDHWRDSSESFALLESVLERELPCENLVDIDTLNLHGLASFRQFYRTKVPSARSVSYFRKYVLTAWFEARGCPLQIGELEFAERDPTSGHTIVDARHRSGRTLDIRFGWNP